MPNDIQVDQEETKKRSVKDIFKDAFVIKDARSIAINLIEQKIVPSIKDAAWDLIGGTIKGLIYHTDKDKKRLNAKLGESDGPYRDYAGRKGASDMFMVGNPVPLSKIKRLMFSDRDTAAVIYSEMIDKINETGKVTVYDYYKMCFSDDPDKARSMVDFAKGNFGWVNLPIKPEIVSVIRGDVTKYYLNLPEPININ